MAGLYIHIPYCKQACHYCDFHFSTNREASGDLCTAIAKEFELRKDYLHNEKIETIYFGGGTPSILSLNELDIIFEAIHKNFVIDSHPEITLEANPDDLTKEKLRELRHASVNRLSVGIQSFDDTVLKFLNRAHSQTDAERCILLARDAGFSNISLDLIYAIPNQDSIQWKNNVQKAIGLQPEHISAYSLTIEDKTVFGQWQKKGKLKVMDDEIAADQFEILMQELTDAGYDHYEISNFSKPDLYSQHNSGYWKQKKYLGAGPSAHSYDLTSRQFNIGNNHLYVKSLGEGIIPFEKESLSPEDRINEYVFTTLRTKWGCDLNYLKTEFLFDLRLENSELLNSYLDQRLIQINREIMSLTQKGKLFADKIASDLFVTV